MNLCFFFPFGHTLLDILLPHFCLNHMIDLSFNEAKMLVAVTFQKVGDNKRERVIFALVHQKLFRISLSIWHGLGGKDSYMRSGSGADLSKF